MNCTVGAPNVKSLAKAIQALSRIGDDLYIESLPTGLIFRTVNSSRSAYVCFTFNPSFFVQYDGNVNAKCKVSLKSCLMAFRSLPAMEKNVEKCIIDAGSLDCTLLIKFHCKHDLTEVYHLPFIENETVQAAFRDQQFNSKLTAQSKLLSEGIQNFSSTVEEITLTVATNGLTLKNYIDDDMEKNKMIHTELNFEADEFENFEVEEEVEVTFCLKEMKAMLNFAEGFSVPVEINCHSAGKPIMFSVCGLPGVESQFVLATLAEKEGSPPPSAAAGSATASERNSSRKSKKARTRNHVPKGRTYGNSTPGNTEDASQNLETDDDIPPEIMITDEDGRIASLEDNQNHAGEENDGEYIVPSPPQKKKFRDMFLGLSQSSQYTSVLPENDEILAKDSDVED